MTISLRGIDLAPAQGEAAYASLAEVADRFYRVRDPRAAFPEIYGVITREVAAELRSAECGFIEPAAISELMGRFATRYLETLQWSLDGARQDCEAWRVAYEYAARRATIPFQDVVLGLSAHINYDLAVGISQTIIANGLHQDERMTARFKHDHDHVNVLLRRSVPECFERVVSRYGCRFSQLAWSRGSRPVTFRVVMSVLSVWRERIWSDVLRLLAAGDDDAARAAVLSGMNRRSGLIARGLVAPSAPWLAGRSIRRVVRPDRTVGRAADA